VSLADPPGVKTVHVESAQEMLAACEAEIPADAAVCAAAVADWRAEKAAGQKLKKEGKKTALSLVENPDILATLSRHKRHRPALVIGFAAETEKLIENARAKLKQKRCDWIVANDVSPSRGVMGGDDNRVHLVFAGGDEAWPLMSKEEVAARLAQRIASHLTAKRKAAE
jgi:phosphopantothenoylcysteine decarboxylase/phosphopantothenate--cysteine ligase